MIDEVWIERLLAGDQQQGRALIFTSGLFRPVPDFLRFDGIVPRPARVVTPVEVLLPAWSTQLIENRSIAKTARSCGATRLECRRARRRRRPMFRWSMSGERFRGTLASPRESPVGGHRSCYPPLPPHHQRTSI